MSGKYLPAIAAAFILSVTPVALAQEQEGTGSFLDTLVVTAARTPERLRDVPQYMEVVTEEQIRDSGASDVTDVLEEHGIQVHFQNARNYGNDVIVMRGLETSTHGFDVLSGVQVLLNGRRIGIDSLSIMGTHAVQRIEIIHGPGSVMYGSAGMGGVVNIITKRGSETPEARAEIGIGEFGEGKASIYGSTKTGRLDIAAAFSYSKAGDYSAGDGARIEKSGNHGRNNYYLNTGWNFDDRNRLGLILQGSAISEGQSPMEEYTVTGSGYASIPVPYRGRPYYNFQDKALHSGDLIYEGSAESGDLDWLVRYYYGEGTYSLYRRSYLADGSVPLDNSGNSKSAFQGAQAQVGWDYGPLHLTAGVDWTQNEMTQEQGNNSYVVATQDRSSYASSTLENIGAFLLAKLSLLERRNLVFTAGVRYDKLTIDIDRKSAREPDWQHDTRVFTKVIPSFGVAWSPTEYLKLRANVGEAFRAPSPRQLVGNFYMGSRYYWGDPNLKPEESLTWDFGFDVNYRHLIFSATYFSSDYKNYIGTVSPAPPRTGTQYVNIEDVRLAGFEASARWNVGRELGYEFDLTPWFGLTRMLKLEQGNGDKLPDVANLVFSAGVDFRSEAIGLKARLKAVYYGKPDITTFSTQRAPAETGGATVFDFSATKRLISFGDQGELSLTATVNNLFNKLYSDTGQVAMPGRAIYMGLVYDY
ncbi:MAG: TonB-dependent receptor [Deltaproteobacteria bacterium]|jgi:vitamin B12 transporter|nr:TonB-dependent receptor [Deltaproteobacteria bacterium]